MEPGNTLISSDTFNTRSFFTCKYFPASFVTISYTAAAVQKQQKFKPKITKYKKTLMKKRHFIINMHLKYKN